MTRTYVSAALRQAVIERANGLTAEGRVTSTILQFNHPDRLVERQRLMRIGRYPSGSGGDEF